MQNFEIANEFIDVEVEDDLTKAVFGCMELLSTDALNEVFKQTELGIQFESEPNFIFHQTVDRREPDVVIEDGQNLTVMVEAKLGAHTDTQQLSDEYADLTERWHSDTLRLLHVTDTQHRPRKIDQTDIPADHLLWTSWRRISVALLNTGPTIGNSTDRRIMGMLTQIFEKYGFAPFGGFTLMKESQTLSNQLQHAYRVREQYYDEINAFRKDVEHDLTDEVKFWRFFRRGISGGMTSGQKTFPTKNYERLPKHLWFGYIPRGEEPIPAAGNYHQNHLTLDFNSQTGTIRAGYLMTTAGGKVRDDCYRKLLHEHKDAVLKMIEEHDLSPYTTSYSLSDTLTPTDEIDQFLEEIGDASYDIQTWGKRFLIANTWSADELPTRGEEDELFTPAEVTKDVAKSLNELHRLTHHEYGRIFYPDVD